MKPTPYYDDPEYGIQIFWGDCRDILPHLEKVDLVLTDPQYGIKRDKGFEGFEGFGGFGGFGTPIARRRYEDDDWDSKRPDKETFDLLLSKCNDAIIFGGNFFADILPQGKHWLVWDKLNTMPTFGDCELLWTSFNRNSVKKITREYNGLIGKESTRYHPTQKPLNLIIDILNTYGGNTICDPFCGPVDRHTIYRQEKEIERLKTHINRGFCVYCGEQKHDETGQCPAIEKQRDIIYELTTENTKLKEALEKINKDATSGCNNCFYIKDIAREALKSE